LLARRADIAMARFTTHLVTLAALVATSFPARAQPTDDDPAGPTTRPPPVEPEAELASLVARIEALERRANEAEARAAAAEARSTARAASPPPADDAHEITAALDGYVEANYSYNFNRPQNSITDYRGFDNRHDSFTLSNAVLGASFDYASLRGRLALQIGHTPSTYYLGEPLSPGGAASATTGAEVFKYIQEAFVGYEAPIGNGLELRAGVLLSPVGYEGIAVKDNFNWSRSNLFFGLPFYHTGVQASYALTDEVTTMLMVCNGATGVVDNNYWKSVTTQWIFQPLPETLTLSLLYFGGPERPRGAPENVPGVEPWRHLFDLWAEVHATDWLTFAAQGDAGFERNAFGTSWWATGAGYARVQPLSWMYLAVRGDVFREHAAENGTGAAAERIFWPAELHGSATLTLDLRPHENLSVRAEYRHDEADSEMFFEGAVAGDGIADAYVANARRQDTLTIGATAWF
jgi:hypothetical protein